EHRSDQEEQADDDANGLGRLQQRGKGLERVVTKPGAEQEVLAWIDEDHVGDSQATGTSDESDENGHQWREPDEQAIRVTLEEESDTEAEKGRNQGEIL